jgi:hypothetical protein
MRGHFLSGGLPQSMFSSSWIVQVLLPTEMEGQHMANMMRLMLKWKTLMMNAEVLLMRSMIMQMLMAL